MGEGEKRGNMGGKGDDNGVVVRVEMEGDLRMEVVDKEMEY